MFASLLGREEVPPSDQESESVIMPNDEQAEKLRVLVSSLRRQRGYKRAAITRQEKNIRELLKSDPIDVNKLQLTLDRLEEEFTASRKLTEQLLDHLQEGTAEAQTEADDIESRKDDFVAIKCECLTAIKKFESSKSVSSESSSKRDNTIDAVQALQFAQTDIESYDGNPLKFQEWWDSFNENFHKNPTISDGKKLANFKRKTTGRAHAFLEQYRTEDKNYETARARFKETFGRPRLLVREHIRKFLEFEGTDEQDVTAMRSVLNKV